MSTGESVHNYQSRVHFLQDIEQLQQAVSVNPMDFASWTKLLAAAEASVRWELLMTISLLTISRETLVPSDHTLIPS